MQCAMCRVGRMDVYMDKKSFVGGILIGALITAVTLQSLPRLSPDSEVSLAKASPGSASHAEASITPPPATVTPAAPLPTHTPQPLVQVSDILPPNYDLGVSFGDVVVKMVEAGAIDKHKFLQLYAGRGGLRPEQARLLDDPSRAPIVLNQGNAGLLLNLFWPLGIANRSQVLSQGPMGTKYKDRVGNLASTGGWTLATRDGGEIVNTLSLVRLTAEQDATVMEIAQHIHRPCCANHTAFPDCNHGAAMLGFIELAVAQGMPPAEVYKKALVLNAYWFPQNYAELATYFKARRGIDWQAADPVEVLGAEYSSLDGAAAVTAQLQADGLLPEAPDGGGCGA